MTRFWPLLFLLISCRGTHVTTKEALPPAGLFHVKEITEVWMRQHHIPELAISYISGGKVEQLSVFGELEPGGPAPANSIWNVASLTKPVTTMVALKLAGAGKFSLDEPLKEYYLDPNLAGDSLLDGLTARHILSHRSGLPNWRREMPEGKLGFLFPPGTGYKYSGEGFEYLRKALEAKFGKGLNDLATELIFEPLKMQDTRYFWDEGMDISRFAKGHRGVGKTYPTYKHSTANAADDLLTTLEDYSKFVIHVMEGAGLPDTLFRKMTSPVHRLKENKSVGLGWFIYENLDSTGAACLSHGGDDQGVHTIVFLIPSTGEALIIFTNSDNGTSAYEPIVQHYLKEKGKRMVEIEMK